MYPRLFFRSLVRSGSSVDGFGGALPFSSGVRMGERLSCCCVIESPWFRQLFVVECVGLEGWFIFGEVPAGF